MRHNFMWNNFHIFVSRSLSATAILWHMLSKNRSFWLCSMFIFVLNCQLHDMPVSSVMKVVVKFHQNCVCSFGEETKYLFCRSNQPLLFLFFPAFGINSHTVFNPILPSRSSKQLLSTISYLPPSKITIFSTPVNPPQTHLLQIPCFPLWKSL